MRGHIVPEFSVIREEKEKQSSRIKEAAIREMSMSHILDKLRDVTRAVEEYGREVNENTYVGLAVAVFNAVREQAEAFTPFHNGPMNETVPGKVRITKGSCYVICTSAEEAASCPDPHCIVLGLREIIEKAWKDEDSNGICVNPYGEHPCLIPREYVLILLQQMRDSFP